MVLHQQIQRVLLLGVRFESPAPAPPPRAPERLATLIAAIAPAHRAFDERAVHYGHRYRSGFWSIYLLSAIAVLCAILPLALGWDNPGSTLHPYAGLWAVAEVCVIAAVSTIFWLGHRRDWQGQWLRTRTTAELTWYLPLLAPLVDFQHGTEDTNWYTRVFDPGEHVESAGEVAAICANNESLARTALEHAWADPVFVAAYAEWTIAILHEQRSYHHGIAQKQHALMHRVHGVNSCLFGLTAVAALSHLLVHTLWLSLITTFFPALGASLHGALAQSEAYRLSVTSERLVRELQLSVERIRQALAEAGATAHSLGARVSHAAAVKASIEDALALILEEHQDWQMLVRPHHLPLA
jgi:hypothetical protein